jgi:hypothetical protein
LTLFTAACGLWLSNATPTVWVVICKLESSLREFALAEKLVNSVLQALSTTALMAGGVGQIMSFATGEVRRVVGKVKLTDSRSGHGAG